MASRFDNPIATTLGARGKTLEHCALFDKNGFYPKLVNVSAIVVFGIGNSQFQHLFDDADTFLRAELQHG